MTPVRLRLGISTCPNDTFAFHGLLTGAVRPRGVELEIELADIEQLNRRLLRGELDLAKGSFALALRARERLGVLSAGAALGRGVGPVVLARAGAPSTGGRVLAPGEHTTATMLWRLFHADDVEPEQVVFSAIIPALAQGAAQRGVCIHEARFTFAQHGLRMVEDLGQSWEQATGLPLPLGGVLVRATAAPHATDIAGAIRASIAHARSDPTGALATMRAHSQEHSDAVLWQHVELYVTRETERLSSEGRRALAVLAQRARAAGLAESDTPLEVLGD